MTTLHKLIESYQTMADAANYLMPPQINQLIDTYLRWSSHEIYGRMREVMEVLAIIGKILDVILGKVLSAIYAEQYPRDSIIPPGKYVQLQRPAYRRLLRCAILSERFEPLIENPLPESVARVAKYAEKAVAKTIGEQSLDTPKQRGEALALVTVAK